MIIFLLARAQTTEKYAIVKLREAVNRCHRISNIINEKLLLYTYDRVLRKI